MNKRRAFLKGFLLAAGLAVIFMAGRVSAAHGFESVDNVSRSVENWAREIDAMGDDLKAIRRDGIPVQVQTKFGFSLELKLKTNLQQS